MFLIVLILILRDTPNLKIATDINNFTSRRQSLESAQRSSVLGVVMDNVFHRRQIGALDDIFFFSRPGLYFDTVKLLPLALSLYIALWCVQYCALKTQGLYKFLSAMPAVLSIFCLIYTVKCAALLNAIYHIDKDAMLEVLEQVRNMHLFGHVCSIENQGSMFRRKVAVCLEKRYEKSYFPNLISWGIPILSCAISFVQ